MSNFYFILRTSFSINSIWMQPHHILWEYWTKVSKTNFYINYQKYLQSNYEFGGTPYFCGNVWKPKIVIRFTEINSCGWKLLFLKLQLIWLRTLTFVQVKLCKTKKKSCFVFNALSQCTSVNMQIERLVVGNTEMIIIFSWRLVYHHWHHRLKLLNCGYKPFNGFEIL